MNTDDVVGPNVSVFREYMGRGKLVSLSTSAGGSLMMCSCWYAASSDLRHLYFASRVDRQHSQNIRENGLIAGSVIAIELVGLGQKTQGVFLSGTSRQCDGEGLASAYAIYAARWPQVREMFSVEDIRSGATPMRIYEISIAEYVFVDEVSDPVNVRKVIPLNAL
jgi:uncharacterized protein YhbP (UPF0306 family)